MTPALTIKPASRIIFLDAKQVIQLDLFPKEESNMPYNTGGRAIANKLTGAHEKNNFKQGISGSGTPKKPGPATRASTAGNPTSSGGINRATKGKS